MAQLRPSEIDEHWPARVADVHFGIKRTFSKMAWLLGWRDPFIARRSEYYMGASREEITTRLEMLIRSEMPPNELEGDDE